MNIIKAIEDILIFLAIASLWPGFILDWPHPIWDWLMYAMVGVMALVLLRRVKQLQIALEERRKEHQKR